MNVVARRSGDRFATVTFYRVGYHISIDALVNIARNGVVPTIRGVPKTEMNVILGIDNRIRRARLEGK